MSRISLTRRTVLQAAAATTLAMPFVRGAFAAGKLSCRFWDHWVPYQPSTKLCHEWAEKNKVDITIDYITSQGDKLNLTIAAEAQSNQATTISMQDSQPGAGRQARTGRRSRGAPHQTIWRDAAGVRIPRQAKGPLDRRPHRHPRHVPNSLRAHRHAQGNMRVSM